MSLPPPLPCVTQITNNLLKMKMSRESKTYIILPTHYTSRHARKRPFDLVAWGIACVAGVRRGEKEESRLRRAREAINSDPFPPHLRLTKQLTQGNEPH